MSLLNSKNELIQLFKELKQEFENFLSEEKIERNFPQLNQISTISMDENSMGLILEAIISFICILDFGTTGTLSLLLGLPIYVFTGKKKESIEILLRENANQMFSKFKSVSLEGDLIKKTAEDFIMINSLNIQNVLMMSMKMIWIYLQLINYIKRMNI